MKKRIFGFDISVSAIGWAIVELEENEQTQETSAPFSSDKTRDETRSQTSDEPASSTPRIIRSGVRAFVAAKAKNKAGPLEKIRQNKKMIRRKHRRKARRMEGIKNLFIALDLTTKEELERIYAFQMGGDVWKLRVKALSEKLDRKELLRVLTHMAKHRGFKSYRKDKISNKRTDVDTEETGLILKAIKENKEQLSKGQTLAQVILQRAGEQGKKRNYSTLDEEGKSVSIYVNSIPRGEILRELKLIYKAQKQYGIFTRKLFKDFSKIAFRHRASLPRTKSEEKDEALEKGLYLRPRPLENKKRPAVANRMIAQLRKVYNAMVRTHGQPDEINLSFSKDTRKTGRQRRLEQKYKKERLKAREEHLEKKLEAENESNPTSNATNSFDMRLRKQIEKRSQSAYFAKHIEKYVQEEIDFSNSLFNDRKKVCVKTESLIDFLSKAWHLDSDKDESEKYYAQSAIITACSTQETLDALLSPPWQTFKEDVKTSLREIIVSRPPRKKATGELHKETIQSIKSQEEPDEKIGVRIRGGFAYHSFMFRIDVFVKDSHFGQKEYYFIPLYLSDIGKEILPNKACVAGKPQSQWIEMDVQYTFLFSLYKSDFIKLKKDDIEMMGYFVSANRGGASIVLDGHDRSFLIDAISIRKLKFFKKFQVTPLGDLIEVKKEKRLALNLLSKTRSEEEEVL